MSLEVQIGADKSEFDKKIKEIEFDIKELSKEKSIQIKAGLDTTEITKNIKDAKKSLSDLKTTLKDTGSAFQGATKPIWNAGHTLTNFSRIAQDAPFGIMGIGNNITATAEAFGSLSQSTGGAGNALKAVGASMLGPGGVIFAISLLTTGLTIMSQKGLTVGDVFNKLTGNFDEFKQSLKEVNKEAAKNSAEQVASVGAYVSAAKDINLSMRDRLIAVKKLQDEYPAFFGNLTKEQILNGNVANAVRDVIAALKAKARAQAYAGKLGDLASKEVDLREKETALIKLHNDELKKRNELQKDLTSKQFNEATFKAWQQADRALRTYKDDLADVQSEIRSNMALMDKWAAKSNVEVKASIALDFQPEKVKKIKKIKDVGADEIQVKVTPVLDLAMPKAFNIEEELNKQYQSVKFDPFASIVERMEASKEQWIRKTKGAYTEMSLALIEFNKGMNDLVKTGLIDTFGGIGEAIGSALASGTNVLQSVGASLISSMGMILSSIGDKLIALGVASLLAATVFSTFGSALGVGAALAAIAGGVALKAGGSLISKQAQKAGGGTTGNQMSAGNSVSTPTSSVNNTGGGGGYQNVVFEISGQSLVGVLSNTLNKNTKLGGSIAI